MTNRTSLILFSAILLFCAVFAHAQVSPLMGLGNVQFFDNNGAPLTAGVLYSYQAGTSTQQATYTDNTGAAQNPNPVPFGSGARGSIWLLSGAFYKFVLCLQNDGAFCAPADVLFSVDQVPGGGGSGGGGGGSPFIGTFISGSANPATTGILRLASGDTVCWRNVAGTANLCWKKDTSDLLSWDGGSVKFPEVAAPSSISAFDLLWADSTAHRWKMANNGGAAAQLVASGVDINVSDQVTQLHFGATATPLSGTPPTTGQNLTWNGTNIVGTAGAPQVIYSTRTGSITTAVGIVTMVTPTADTTYRFSAYIHQTVAGVGCTGATIMSLGVFYTDQAAAAAFTVFFPAENGANSTPTNNSGSISITNAAGFNGSAGNPNTLSTVVASPFRVKANTAVQMTGGLSVGAGCTTTPAYEVVPLLEQMPG